MNQRRSLQPVYIYHLPTHHWMSNHSNKGSSEVCFDPNASWALILGTSFDSGHEKATHPRNLIEKFFCRTSCTFFVTSSGSLKSAWRKLASMILFGNELRRRRLFCLSSSYFFFRAILLPRAVRAWWQFEGVPKSQPEESDGMFVVVSFSSVIVFAFVVELPRLNWVISCFTLKNIFQIFVKLLKCVFLLCWKRIIFEIWLTVRMRWKG